MIPRETHPGAKEAFDEIQTLLRAENPGLAANFARCVAENILLIRQNPRLHHESRFALRRVNLRPQFGEYGIAFLRWQEKAIAHAKRHPFYFLDRIGEARGMFEKRLSSQVFSPYGNGAWRNTCACFNTSFVRRTSTCSPLSYQA